MHVLLLLPCAKPADVMANPPEGPPSPFSCRGVRYAGRHTEGPKRVHPERRQITRIQARGYYATEDEEGCRFGTHRGKPYGGDVRSRRYVGEVYRHCRSRQNGSCAGKLGVAMDSMDYWRLNDELSIVQAALLVTGEDPSGSASYVESWSPENRPPGYEAAKTAIKNALRSGLLKGNLCPRYIYNENGFVTDEIPKTVDLDESRIDVASLKEWLAGRGFKTGFFFPLASGAPSYLDSVHPHYAPKLAAAVQAWQAVENTELGGKSPKQMLCKWLREHAAEFGLSDDDGKPNETGIEETAKVANWQPGGGAPKTSA